MTGGRIAYLGCLRNPLSQVVVALLAFVLEREFHLGAVGRDLALLDDDVLLDHLGDAQVAQRPGSAFDRHFRRSLPRLCAGANHFDYVVDALGHVSLPGGTGSLARRRTASQIRLRISRTPNCGGRCCRTARTGLRPRPRGASSRPHSGSAVMSSEKESTKRSARLVPLPFTTLGDLLAYGLEVHV